MTEVYRQFAGVLLVLGTLVCLLYFAQRRGWAVWNGGRTQSGNRPVVTVLERVRLTPQHTLHVLSINGKHLVVTSSPGSCQLITELPADSSASSVSLGKAS